MRNRSYTLGNIYTRKLQVRVSGLHVTIGGNKQVDTKPIITTFNQKCHKCAQMWGDIVVNLSNRLKKSSDP